MRSNAIAVKEDFYRAAGHPDIDLLLDILIGAGVVLCIHADVVVVLNCGNSPCGQLERMSGRGSKKSFSSSTRKLGSRFSSERAYD